MIMLVPTRLHRLSAALPGASVDILGEILHPVHQIHHPAAVQMQHLLLTLSRHPAVLHSKIAVVLLGTKQKADRWQ